MTEVIKTTIQITMESSAIVPVAYKTQNDIKFMTPKISVNTKVSCRTVTFLNKAF